MAVDLSKAIATERYRVGKGNERRGGQQQQQCWVSLSYGTGLVLSLSPLPS